MISRVKVLATGEPSLDDLLPSGHEIPTDSGLVYLVGQNGSGKTAFLRLLQTSILNKLFYDMHGRTILPQLLIVNARGWSVGEDEYKRAGISEADRGRYTRIDADMVHSLRTYQRLFPELGLTEKDLIHLPTLERKEKFTFPTKERYYEFINAVAALASPKERDPFGQREKQAWEIAGQTSRGQNGLVDYSKATNTLIDIFKRELGSRFTDIPDFIYGPVLDGFRSGKAIWGYEFYKSDTEYHMGVSGHKKEQGPKLIRESRLDELQQRIKQITTEREDRTMWAWFKPENYDAPLFCYEASPHIKVRGQISLDDFDSSVNIPINHLVYNPQLKASERLSSGQSAVQEFEGHFKTIDRFFSEGKLPMEQYLLNRMVPHGERRIQEALRNVPKYLNIPAGAHLAFFVDEPDVYLDVVNQMKIRETLFGLLDKYSPRLQLFLATNSTDLIRAAPTDTLFIECNFGKPVTIRRDYKP